MIRRACRFYETQSATCATLSAAEYCEEIADEIARGEVGK